MRYEEKLKRGEGSKLARRCWEKRKKEEYFEVKRGAKKILWRSYAQCYGINSRGINCMLAQCKPQWHILLLYGYC